MRRKHHDSDHRARDQLKVREQSAILSGSENPMWQPDPPDVESFQSFLDWLKKRQYREHFVRWLNTQTFTDELPEEARTKVLPILREAFEHCGENEEEFWDYIEPFATEKDPGSFLPFFSFSRGVP